MASTLYTYSIGNFDVISDGHVDRKIVQEMIDATLAEKRSQGEIDDIRQYSSYEHFPGNSLNPTEKPVADVQYVAMDTKVEYNWVIDNSLAGGHYEMINEPMTKEDIQDIFKTPNPNQKPEV